VFICVHQSKNHASLIESHSAIRLVHHPRTDFDGDNAWLNFTLLKMCVQLIFQTSIIASKKPIKHGALLFLAL
jgi:hypothetical protein